MLPLLHTGGKKTFQITVNSEKYCENCVVLENQLTSVQEEPKSAKLIINLLIKNTDQKEANTDKCVKEATSEETNKKLSTWADVVKGVKEHDTYMHKLDLNLYRI
jgi:predicted DsbA family dithiol-disulfide isomerase